MKTFFLLVILIFSGSNLLAQQDAGKETGNYFKSDGGRQFERTLQPWRYQYVASTYEEAASPKIGTLIFWRSISLYDKTTRMSWRPDICYDIYRQQDSALVTNLARKLRSYSTCDSINKGGDILSLGNFILFNSSPCVNCASSSNVDYCRNIIRYILSSVKQTDSNDFNKILKQFVIAKGKFRG